MKRALGYTGITLALGIGCSKSERPIESGRSYTSVTYTDTTRETFARTDRAITGVVIAGGDSVRFRIHTAPDDLVSMVDFTLHPASSRDDKPHTRRIGMPQNTLPIMGTSVAFLEQLLRRARAIGGDSVSIPIMMVGAQASLDVFTVIRNGPDSLVLVGPDGNWTNAIHLALDSAGRVRGGTIPLSGTRITAITP
ncbi:MAG TPA: hypothetical protein VG454_02700 [Gemmatimonadales bacterium]|nr:hypothetical protein [Gemmatimonadales bacterium]